MVEVPRQASCTSVNPNINYYKIKLMMSIQLYTKPLQSNDTVQVYCVCAANDYTSVPPGRLVLFGCLNLHLVSLNSQFLMGGVFAQL